MEGRTDGRFDERVDPRGLGGGIRKPVGGNNFSHGGTEKFQCVKQSARSAVVMSDVSDVGREESLLHSKSNRGRSACPTDRTNFEVSRQGTRQFATSPT